MNIKHLRLRWSTAPAAALAGLLGWVGLSPGWAAPQPFGVPVRLSFKFILNAAGNRPPTGAINTTAEVEAQVDHGNAVLAFWKSELRFHNLEIVDIGGAATNYYDAGTGSRDALRNAAIASPTTFRWRNDAVNIYITGAGGSAISDFPPDNNIILVCQGAHDTTVPHEIGHSLNLYHTHSTAVGGDDGCTDTLRDGDGWDRDDIANNAYGQPYINLNSAQQYQVNMVWSNLMSYHNTDHRWMLSSCQLDRMSAQAYADRNWLLSKTAVYVDAAAAGTQNGSFLNPYQNIQQAIAAGVLNNRVLVLDAGTHNDPTSVISTRTDVVPRKGTAYVRDAEPLYQLPYTLEESKNPQVRAAVVRAQQTDRQNDIEAVIANLLEAEKHATGREKSALQLELAQRYRDSDRLEEAEAWFRKTAEGADQEELRKQSLRKADGMKQKAKEKREQKEKKAEADGDSDQQPAEGDNGQQ